MRNLKKILALVLALVMSFSLMATANAFTDSDKINDTYEEAVEVLSALKVFQGYENGSFVPQGSITRAEVAAIIYRIVTGDVADKQVGIYADYNKFNDVKSTSWYAGYVNFCANAEYIKGYDAKTFGPNDPVTGYQALAMILRAVGYDKNGEFTGTGWQTQTAAVGKKLGITNNVSEGTLGVAATREVVAEILFRSILVPQVEYTVAFGYQSIGQVSIGYETFGLAYAEGIVTGNQATGAAATVVSKDYVANTTTDLRFGTKTDLNMIGHSVKVWYDARTSAVANGVYGTVYTLMDKSTAETVLTASELVGKVGTSTYYSNNYGPFSKGIHTPNVSKYIIIDAGKAVISVDEYVAQIYAINSYAVTPTVTLTERANHGTGAVGQVAYKQSVLTGFDASTMAVRDYVMVTQINGGVFTNIVELTNMKQGVVRYSDSQGNVTLTDGTVLTRSAAKVYASATGILPQAAAFSTLTNYTFLLDNDGRYVGSWETVSDFLFATYAYYMIDNAATAQMSYYVTGVTADGQVVTRQITADDYNGRLIMNAIPTLSTGIQNINNANAVGQDRSLQMTNVDNIYNVGNCTATHIGDATVANGSATILANTIAIGVNNNYFVDENTKFYFVSGTAAQPQVQEVVGKTALLGAGDAYTLPANSVITTTVLNYSVSTAANFHVDTVLVKAPYAPNAAADLYYIGEKDLTDANGDGRVDYTTGVTSTLGGVASSLIGVHKNAKALTFDVWVPTANTGVDASDAYFYTHSTNAAGVTDLDALYQGANANRAIQVYYDAAISFAGTSGLYITNTAGTVVNRIAENAVIVDLRDNQVASGDAANGFVGTSQLAEITDVATLISRAAEYAFTVDAAGTANGVTIVYIKSAQIRDLTRTVTINVVRDGAAVANPTDYYTLLTGIAQSGDAVGYNGVVDFQLTAAAAGATVTVGTSTLTAGSKLINGVVVNNVYTVSGITAPVVVTITLPAERIVNMIKEITPVGESTTQIATNQTGYRSLAVAVANRTTLEVRNAAAINFNVDRTLVIPGNEGAVAGWPMKVVAFTTSADATLDNFNARVAANDAGTTSSDNNVSVQDLTAASVVVVRYCQQGTGNYFYYAFQVSNNA